MSAGARPMIACTASLACAPVPGAARSASRAIASYRRFSTVAGLRRQYDAQTIRFEPLDAAADLAPLARLPGVERMNPTEDGCELRLQAGTDPAALMREMTALVPPARVELARVRLEDVFIRLVSESVTSEDERSLRANLQGLGVEGAVV